MTKILYDECSLRWRARVLRARSAVIVSPACLATSQSNLRLSDAQQVATIQTSCSDHGGRLAAASCQKGGLIPEFYAQVSDLTAS